MLAYDSYSKSVIATVVQQKIRLFLNIRRIINLPVFETVSPNAPLANQIANKLFEIFTDELKKENIYYEYAFCSIFINSPDYDFVTNDDQVSIQKAEESLKTEFMRVATTEKLFNESASSDQFEGPDLLFNFLKDKKFQREIPTFSRRLKLGSQTDSFIKGKIGKLTASSLLGTDILKAESNEKTISTMMTQNQSPFYVDFFYRKKPDINITSDDREYRYSYIGLGDGYEGKIPFQTNKDFAYRGARIMFNLTSAITPNTTQSDVFGKIKYFPLNPSRFLPYSLNLLNILDVQNPSTARTYVKKFPLPFLSNYQNTKKSATEPSTPSNRLADSVGLGDPTFLSSAVFKLQFGNNPDNLSVDSPHFLSGRVKTKFEVDSNYFLALRKALGNVLNWDYLSWSKSLVCFEVPASAQSSSPVDEFLFCYFPIIVAEFVDETNTLSDDQIVQQLIQTQEAKFLESSIDLEELNKTKSGPVQIIINNEENLKFIKLGYVTPINIGNSSSQVKTFKQLDDISKELDNTLSNLINLDGEQ